MADGCDVVVIGGGMAGVSIGYELAANHRVALVETESMLATHSTGRSAATYLPSYGGAQVRALTAASRARFDELTERFGLPEPLTPRAVLFVATDEPSEREAQQLLDERAGQAGELTRLETSQAVRLCPALNAEQVRFAALDSHGEDIDVLSLHQGYLRGLRQRGGTVHTRAPVSRITGRRTGWRVEAGEHTLDCSIVVNAAGAWADRTAAVAGVPTVGLVPKRRSAFVSPVAENSGWRRDAPVIADAAERGYVKPEGTGVLGSPADAEPCEPGDARADELAIAGAIEQINRMTRLGLRTVHRSWAGLRTFAPDGAPVVGGVPGYEGFVYFAGQGGYGIQMAPALAALGAAVCTGDQPPADIDLDPAQVAPTRFAPGE